MEFDEVSEENRVRDGGRNSPPHITPTPDGWYHHPPWTERRDTMQGMDQGLSSVRGGMHLLLPRWLLP